MKILNFTPIFSEKLRKNELSTVSFQSNQPINDHSDNVVDKLEYDGNIKAGLIKKKPANFLESANKYFKFPLNMIDKFQLESAKSIWDGHNTVVTAPTGTGKTLIAEYAIAKNMDNDKRTFYTTPLKALSNQKYYDFCKQYGRENVGLMTGDIKFNTQAPVIVMTTEIYRNMLTARSHEEVAKTLGNLGTVVFDEFHYMNDQDRGAVWEESMLFSPPNVQMLALSATVKNNESIKQWVSTLNYDKPTDLVDVSADNRHVPLKYYVYDYSQPGALDTFMTGKISTEELHTQYDNGKMANAKIAVLSSLSEKLGGKAEVKTALEFLDKLPKDNKGYIEDAVLEDSLKAKGNFEADEIDKVVTALICHKTKARKVNVKEIAEKNIIKAPDPVEVLINDVIDNPENKKQPLNFVISHKRKTYEFMSRFLETKEKSLVTPDEKIVIEQVVDSTKKEMEKQLADLKRVDRKNIKVRELRDELAFLEKNKDVSLLSEGIAVRTPLMSKLYEKIADKLTEKGLIKVNFTTRDMLQDDFKCDINSTKKTPVVKYIEDQSKKAKGIVFFENEQACSNAASSYIEKGEDLLNDEEKIIVNDKVEQYKNYFEENGLQTSNVNLTLLSKGVGAIHPHVDGFEKFVVKNLFKEGYLKQLLSVEDFISTDEYKRTPDSVQQSSKYPPMVDMIQTLNKEEKLPAIVFIFKRADCEYNVQQFVKNSETLLNDEEKEKVIDTVLEFKNKNIFLGNDFIGNSDRVRETDIPDNLKSRKHEIIANVPRSLLFGVAAHHAGMLPAYKSLIEKLFQDKVLKVVYSTETLAAGINMPARTTVLTDMEKPGKDEAGQIRRVHLTANSFQQMAGRAGRRGKDNVGYVILCDKHDGSLKKDPLDEAFSLATCEPDTIKSRLKPTYNLLTSIISQNGNTDETEDVIKSSFAFKNLELNGEDTEPLYDSYKKRFDGMTNILKARNFIIPTGESNNYEITEKGVIASKVRGVNEVFFAEIISNGYLNDIDPASMAALVSSFVEAKGKPSAAGMAYLREMRTGESSKKVIASMTSIKQLAEQILFQQKEFGLKDEKDYIKLNYSVVPFMNMWAKSKKENATNSWEKIVSLMEHSGVIAYEGDFIRSISMTVEYLRQIEALAPDENVRKNATEAIKLLRKPPVSDLLADYDSEPVKK
ncbi:MAG: DEAD/DEAH box helicase [bacterium]